MPRPAAPAALRPGWTTGACATAATRAACAALLGQPFPDPVTITLPRGQQPAFALALSERGDGWARVGVIKDAGDDPDVTHGALILATVRHGAPGSGVRFRAGEGVGTVTKPGLPLAVGEPAINPVPRRLMTAEVQALAATQGVAADFEIEIAIANGAKLAARTWNPRLGIVGGLSVLGTTGVVVPYSCSAWIHAIERGIDVARAGGLTQVAGCTGRTSEQAAQRLLGLPEGALIDMGDFIGGMLKYLRRHPLPQVVIAGGFAKLSKFADGHLDVHSKRSQVDIAALARRLERLKAPAAVVEAAAAAHTALEVWQLARAHALPLGQVIAHEARAQALTVLAQAPVAVEVLVIDRAGAVIGDSRQD